MSGIAGLIYLKDNVADIEIINSFSASLQHRGPDKICHVIHKNVALIHFLLEDTPESSLECLPHFDRSQHLLFNFDGRIDNREEIYNLLSLEQELADLTDSQLVLAAWIKYEKDCVLHLVGEFAFIVYNLEDGQIFCARDHMGITPFYYYKDDTFFAFASEIKALINLKQLQQRPNLSKIADYLVDLTYDNVSTSYTRVFRLPPGHYLLCQPESKLSTHEYWRLEQHPATTGHCNLFENFRSIFTESINCRLRSQHPIGIRLSGGIDSVSITSVIINLLKEQPTQKLNTFTGIFKNLDQLDETSFIKTYLDHPSITPQYINADRLNPYEAFSEKASFYDEPFIAGHFFMGWELCKRAQKTGIRILFDGYDGDASISYGYGRLYELGRKFRLLTLLYECLQLSDNLLTGLKYFYTILYRLYEYKDPRGDSQRQANIENFVENKVKIFTSNFLNESNIRNRLLFSKQHFPKIGSDDRATQLFHLRHPYTTQVIESLNLDSAYFGMKFCHPFFDKRLLEFCVSLPSSFKLRHGKTRYILRKTFQHQLPNNVYLRQTKTNFVPNVIRAYVSSGWVDKVYQELPDEAFQFIDKKYLQTSLQNLTSQNTTDLMTSLQVIWKAASLGKWLNKN